MLECVFSDPPLGYEMMIDCRWNELVGKLAAWDLRKPSSTLDSAFPQLCKNSTSGKFGGLGFLVENEGAGLDQD